jgi:ceramide glucosyltransferase
MLAAVFEIFYILVILQIASGLYSLWDGFKWLQMVRERLASHAGFYAPVTALICPCKGDESGLIERVQAASQRPVHIVIAGPPKDCGEKVHNLRRAVEALPDKFEVFVFTDSDVRFSHGWLAKLVAPLEDSRIGATTAYRWLIPSGSIGAGALPSALASAWNAAVATLLGRPRERFCWGGGTAIRRKNFSDLGVLEAWDGAVSDDWAMTRAIEASGKSIVFCPECMGATLHPWTGSALLEFTNRQTLITRVYSPRRWLFGAAAHLSYSLTLIYAAVVMVIAMAGGDPWIHLALMALVIPLLAAMKGALRTVAAKELLPEWKVRLEEWSWVWTALAPLVPFLFTWNFLASLATKRIRWRGIRYELISPNTTRILKR